MSIQTVINPTCRYIMFYIECVGPLK